MNQSQFDFNARPQRTRFLFSLMTVSLFKLFYFIHNFLLFPLCSLWEENPTSCKLLVSLFKTTRLLVWSPILKHNVEIFKRTRSQTWKTDLEWKGSSTRSAETLLTLPWLRSPKDLPDNTGIDRHRGFRIKVGHIWLKGGVKCCLFHRSPFHQHLLKHLLVSLMKTCHIQTGNWLRNSCKWEPGNLSV